MKMFGIAVAAALIGTAATAQEVDTIKFICNSPHTVPSVVYDAVDPNTDLIMGISRLPNGCEWTFGNREGEIHETITVIDLPDGRYSRISRVTLNGVEGYSPGIIELLS